MQLKTKELAEWLGLSPATIRLWTTEGYGDFLSPVGRGGDNRTRSFDEQDARVIAFIHALKQQGQDRDEIMITLRQLQAEHWQGLPPMPAAPPGVVTQTINLETAETALITQRNALLREISIKEELIENLETRLQTAENQNTTLQTELTKTKEELGQLRGQLTIIQQERKPAVYWLQVIALITITIIIMAAVVVLYISSRV